MSKIIKKKERLSKTLISRIKNKILVLAEQCVVHRPTAQPTVVISRKYYIILEDETIHSTTFRAKR